MYAQPLFSYIAHYERYRQPHTGAAAPCNNLSEFTVGAERECVCWQNINHCISRQKEYKMRVKIYQINPERDNNRMKFSRTDTYRMQV